MKILMTTDWYAPTVNGVVTSVLNLRRGLEALGHEVRVLTLSQTPYSRCEDGVTYIGAVGAGLVYPGARLRTAPGRELVTELVAWRPDVVHSQCEFSTFLLARKIAAAVGAPLVHTYHTVYEDYTHYFSPSRRWGRAAVAAFSRWVVGQTACTIVPTAKVRTLLEGYEVERPVHVVPTGIDLSRFEKPCDPARLAALRQELDIPAGNFVMVSVGRLAAEKNIEELLNHTAALERPDVTLLLVGDGPYRAALEGRVRALGLEKTVRFAGMVPPEQVPDYYRLGDVFVSASTSETQGLTYVEALAAGVPALCRRDPCLVGVVVDGVNGWQFRDGAEFRTGVARLLKDPGLREEMSKAAAELARREFSIEMFARRTAAVYAQALSKGSLASAA